MEDRFTNKNTVDQAWNSMRGILDKEMPVEEKKRRFALWPLGLAAGFLLVFGFMANWAFDMPDHVAQIETKKEVFDKPTVDTKHSTIKEELLVNESAKETSTKIPSIPKIENQKSVTINQSKQIKSEQNKLPLVNRSQTQTKQVVVNNFEQKTINNHFVVEEEEKYRR